MGETFFGGGNDGYAGKQNVGSAVLYGFDGAREPILIVWELSCSDNRRGGS